MADLSTLIATPSGLWANIINAFTSFTLSSVVAIILITVCIKLLLSPLDYFNKKVARNNARMQTVMKPQMEKLQKQYGHDRNLLNQKTMELYKANGFSMGGSCGVMALYMVLSLVIFGTLFFGVMNLSRYTIEQQYVVTRVAYTTEYNSAYGQATGTEEEKIAYAVTQAQTSALNEYKENQHEFLWVKNVWLPDTPWTNKVLDFNAYINTVGDVINIESFSGIQTYLESVPDLKVTEDANGIKCISLNEFKKLNSTEYEKFFNEFKAEYETVMSKITAEEQGPNGYLIVAVLAILTALCSQWLMQRRTNVKNANPNMPGGPNKILMFILPIIMGFFAIRFNAVFGMYIITNQLMTLLSMPIIDKIIDKSFARADKKHQDEIKVDYSRK